MSYSVWCSRLTKGLIPSPPFSARGALFKNGPSQFSRSAGRPGSPQRLWGDLLGLPVSRRSPRKVRSRERRWALRLPFGPWLIWGQAFSVFPLTPSFHESHPETSRVIISPRPHSVGQALCWVLGTPASRLVPYKGNIFKKE